MSSTKATRKVPVSGAPASPSSVWDLSPSGEDWRLGKPIQASRRRDGRVQKSQRPSGNTRPAKARWTHHYNEWEGLRVGSGLDLPSVTSIDVNRTRRPWRPEVGSQQGIAQTMLVVLKEEQADHSPAREHWQRLDTFLVSQVGRDIFLLSQPGVGAECY